MHLCRKDFEYRAVYPGGETQTLLRVPRYDFNWQLGYPTAEVHWGDQTSEEMMIGYFDLAFDPQLDPHHILQPNRTSAQR